MKYAALAVVVLMPLPQQPPTFRAGVEAVTLDVSVLDAQRHPLTGLSQQDFTILEDGHPRPVVAFAAIGAPRPPAPAVSSASSSPRRDV